MTPHAIRTLLTALAAAGLLPTAAARAGDDPVRINGSGSALEFVRPLVAAYVAAHPEQRFSVSSPLGSSGAIKALLAGALDLAVVSRALTPEEARAARAQPYGRTPLLVVVHPSVTRTDVTTAELEALWAGRAARWPDGSPVRPILRPDAEANTRILSSLSPGMAAADAAARRHPWAMIAVTDPESNDLVARTPGSIGFATLTSVLLGIWPFKPLSLDGVEGNLRALSEGRYPLAKPVLFVTTPASAPVAQALVEFARSPEGRAVAERAGIWVDAGGHP